MIFNCKKYYKFIAIISVIILIFTGCGRLIKNPEEEKKTQDAKKYPPGTLTQMVDVTEKIINDIVQVRAEKESLEREKEHPPGEQIQNKKQQEGDEKQKDDGLNNDNQSQDKQNKQGQDKKTQDKEEKKQQEKIPQVDWKSLEKSAKKLHTNWNDFEVSARENKADNQAIEDFKEQLNTLSEQIMARNEENTLIAANKLYSYYSIFLNLYKHMQPPEVKKVKYLIRQIIINGQREQWDETVTLLKDMENIWEIAKARMIKPNKTVNSRIDLGIKDFSAVAKQQKIDLVKIKGDILLKNLDEIK